MKIDHNEAIKFFESSFSEELRSPCLHPDYVVFDAKRDSDLSPVFFVHSENQSHFYYAFHIARVPGTEVFDIQSPMGYGGPISTTTDTSFLENAWKQFSSWCMEKNVLAEFVRFHPLVGNQQFYNGTIIHDRDVVCLDLEIKDLMASFDKRARTAVRKAEKNELRVEWWEPQKFSSMFSELYLEHMRYLKADEFYRFNQDYLDAISSWRHSYLGVCLQGEEILGASLFIQGPKYLEYHLSASTEKGRSLCATNLLIYEAAKLGQKLGCRVMNLGGGTTSAPDNPLFFFKASFSPLKKAFFIGKKVHKKEMYETLKEKWVAEGKPLTNRVLFYR